MTRILPLIAALILTAVPASAPSAAEDPPIAGPEWAWLAIDGRIAPAPATLAIGADGRVAGQAPCNRYFASNAAALPELALNAMGATRMACPALAEEAEYLDALAAMTLATITDDHLILSGAGGRRMEFYLPDREAEPRCLTCPAAD